MQQPVNFIALAVSSLIPLIIGFIWFHDKVFGKAWLKARKLTQEDEPSLPVTLIVSYIYSFLIALALRLLVIPAYNKESSSFIVGILPGVLLALLVAIPVS